MQTSVDRAIASLEELNKTFKETGIAFLESDYTTTKFKGAFNAHAIRKMFRQSARDMRRPYFEISTTRWSERERDPNSVGKYKYRRTGKTEERHHLRATRTYGADNLVGMFLLTATEGGRWSHNEDAPITYRKMNTAWEFSFAGDIGKAVLDNFIEAARTNPEFKRVLTQQK
jgi:hypothetical protein